MAFLATFLVILVVAPSALAAQYPVDWKLGADYTSWTTKDVHAGDTLGKFSSVFAMHFNPVTCLHG